MHIQLPIITTEDLEDEASRRNWKKVGQILCQAHVFGVVPNYDFKCKADCCERHSILHSMLKYNPPSRVLQQIIHYFPDSVQEMNCRYHLLLHTALAHGASEQVIKKLICLDVNTVSCVDVDGKTSLHLALDGYEILSADLSTRLTCNETMTAVINLLCKIAPSIVKIDNNIVSAVNNDNVDNINNIV